MRIRAVREADAPAVWAIIGPIIRGGAEYALERDMSEADAIAYWYGADRETYVAEVDGEVLGTYYIRPNQPGGGRHVANCGYAVSSAARGRGIARAMCAHSLVRAREAGYRAMQFNFVIATNTRAIALWEGMGFATLARLPGAFVHPAEGEVDALVMYQRLD
ncbi:GNAT family N-acetyltransferase [Acuticoccus sp. I52.16.1]|uniref:GNAT family N-acetyltransferase n=1 Tax=Acuticoccus sp. I52.16.1 TaxID=2928472 RepID=UPI001FD27C37|nr:GNAT family N-acetyltransferase [Acuticoccus sp. I52.16.1]UOM33808.1 GNAT family N-acetyltransferase [Acuticoccus sp. I52.16.1]